MSLGWQTESALLPSTAKPIKVDNKSLVGLKSLVCDQEERLRNKMLAGQNHEINKYQRGRDILKKRDIFVNVNKGILDREKRDQDESSKMAKKDKVYMIMYECSC